ncbi:MAG: hypothetical protein LBJ03_02365 [Holosporales bacterium]|nr:hypothetical protein [Holosporales bacterium]
MNAEQSARLIETRLADMEDILRQLTGVVEQIQHTLDRQINENGKLHQDITIRFDELKTSLQELGESLKKLPQPAAAKKGDKADNAKTPLKTDKPIKSTSEEVKEIKALMAQGSYKTAQTRAKQYIARIGDASPESQAVCYWLGEACYAGKDYGEASLAYVKGYKINPKSSQAPELLYKLSKTLIAIGKKKDAQITLEKLLTDYKDLSPRLKKLAEQEKSKLASKSN